MRARARTALASALVLTLATACGDTTVDRPTPDASGSPSAAETSGTSAPALDPDHVMDPIGPRKGVVAIPDVVVTSVETLDPGTVEAIKKVKGVTDVETFSMVQVIIENETFNVAAVDPATFRNYTLAAIADSQEVWDRIAGGELALDPKLKKKLPQKNPGFLTLGSTEDSGAVHIGAYAESVVNIDAVVNETWVDDLDMPQDNALLVRTGRTAPQKVRAPIEEITGDDAAVAMVDVVAREGLDPDAKQVAVTTGTVADVVGIFRYTAIGGGRIAPEQAWVDSHIITKSVPILGQVTCNKYVFPQLEAALKDVVARGLQDEIHPEEYAGCYYPRFIAGSSKLSNHSFGLALDFNVPGNQRGTVGEMDRGVVAIFKYWGFGWGGDWRYTDPMHFEMVELKNPANP